MCFLLTLHLYIIARWNLIHHRFRVVIEAVIAGEVIGLLKALDIDFPIIPFNDPRRIALYQEVCIKPSVEREFVS